MLKQALDLIHEVPWLMSTAGAALTVCAGYFSAVGRFHDAALLHGAQLHQRELDGTTIGFADRLFLEPLLQIARGKLGTEQFEAAVAEGQVLSQEEAVTRARTWLL